MKIVCRIDSLCGVVHIAATEHVVTDIFFGDTLRAGMCVGDSQLLTQAAQELEEYFAGLRHTFTFPMAFVGTPFQMMVWRALQEIPYGQIRTYGEIAAQIGSPRACRAVGMANNRNPLAIVVPCHRVVGRNGALTGYAGGLDAKAKLLELEQPT